jgi:hypothetical protein
MKAENLLKKKKKDLYKLAERYFHKYIVLRDIKKRGHCITCKAPIEQAGHFNHGGNNRYAFWCDFDERNLNGQCKRCNHFMSGNLNIYSEELIKIYGPEIIGELNALTWKIGDWNNEDLIGIIEKYRKT